MPTIRRITALVSIAFVVSLFGLTAVTKPKHADAETCDIYVSLFKSLPDSGAEFVHPTTMAIDTAGRVPELAPANFYMYTGETEMVKLADSDSPYERRVTKDFRYDTSGFFAGRYPGKIRNIKNCFDRAKDWPKVSRRSFDFLAIRDSIFSKPANRWVAKWQVSNPAFSEDGTEALLFADNFCGGLCGNGSYYLFKKNDDDWQLIGMQTVWIS